MYYFVAFGIFLIGNFCYKSFRINRTFYDSTHQGCGEFFPKLRGGVSAILKHPITVNLSIAQFESSSIIHLQFSV